MPKKTGNRLGPSKFAGKSIFWAVLIHLAIVAAVGVNVYFNDGSLPSLNLGDNSPDPTPVQATAISESELDQEVALLLEQEKIRKQEEIERQQKLDEARLEQQRLEQRREQEQKRLAAITKQREEEERRAQELEQQRQAQQEEVQRIEQEREKEEQELAALEQQRQSAAEELEELKRQQEETARQRSEQQKREAEQAETERARQEAEAQADAIRDRDEQLRSRALSEMAKFTEPIKQKVERNWVRIGDDSNSEAGVLVEVDPSGVVVSAEITRSSGSKQFDRSVLHAIRKASPLPIPKDPEIYDYIRRFNFSFRTPAST